jgi:hypothetical protein
LFFDLAEGKFYGFGAVIGYGHRVSCSAFASIGLAANAAMRDRKPAMHFVRIVAVCNSERQKKSEQKAILIWCLW